MLQAGCRYSELRTATVWLHLIVDDAIRNAFADNTDNNKGLLNPHALHENDEMNAQYCATGLAYRVFQEMPALAQNKSIQPQITEKLENTMAVMAAIGTATDMVDVLDTHSNNREILKDGLRRIDNADEKDLDFVIGNMLARNNIPDGVTAHQLAFNVGAFLNSASRMCYRTICPCNFSHIHRNMTFFTRFL